ncbi:nucleoside phosphorylase domain-containing protein [Aspergillus foveolatus]|uniref:nucleoside phosphorylase domain-containing protein n=1 Tax=Aspergillus foveolatus TaxID=210207 RepID=UPI003CCD8B9F
MFRAEDYTVGWVSALPVELAAAAEMLDEEHQDLPHDPNDDNIYTLGRIGHHNVVIACLPTGRYGTTSAATVAIRMQAKFPSLRFGLMVGVGGGVPGTTDIRLGDVVVSQPSGEHGGVVQYDAGTATASGFIRKSFLNGPPPILLNALSKLRANHLRHRSKIMENLSAFDSLPRFQRVSAGPDRLFTSTYIHEGGSTCEACSEDQVVFRTPRENQAVEIHYGTIASGNQVIRNGITRDQLSRELGGVLCFEMEAAGLMNGFPCLIVRGICDYCDTHKNKNWQPSAAAAAAAYVKDLLSVIPATELVEAPTVERNLESYHPKPVHRITGPVCDANHVTRLAQLAYALYSSFRGAEGPSSLVSELSDELFSLHCSLCHLAKYISVAGLTSNDPSSSTSNVFKRPGVLILRCSDVLRELQMISDNNQHPEKQRESDTVDFKSLSLPSAQWASYRSKLEQMLAEVQWCLSSVDILVDALLRSKKSPTRHKPLNAASEPSRLPYYPDGRSTGHPNLISTQTRFTLGSEAPNIPTIALHATGFPRIKHPESIDIAGSTAIQPMDGRVLPNRTGSTKVPRKTSTSTDPPTFSASTPPEVWLSAIRLQLAAWVSTAAESSQDKRSRQRYLGHALMSLNSYIGSLDDVTSRRQLREELEQYGLMQVIVEMKAVVGDLVMLEKQVEVYLDDKMDDGVVY